ncbi:MAG TPA: hypothetical protein VJ878_02630 [Candidatus Izemoplasmatales bacterium]|nr:hypothetical protein [Candidatus Izemoplasmatales bacterium]
MRVFGRILYAMLAVGLFLGALLISISLMRKQYFSDVFGGSLTNQTSELPEFYYFYASLPDYHQKEPLFSIDDAGYQIRAYEVAMTEMVEDDLDVEEYIYFIVYHDRVEALDQVDRIRISNGLVRDQIDINLIRYQDLDILVSVDSATSKYLYEKSQFEFTNNYDQLLLLDSNDILILESALQLSDSDFIIKTALENYHATNGSLPDESDIDQLNGIGVQDQDILNNFSVVDDYLYILGIVMGIYFLILIFSTYFIFFKKRKKPMQPYE